MQNSMGLVWGIIIVVVLLAGGYLLWANSADDGTNVAVTETSTDTDTDTDTAPATASVSYNGSSFSPSAVTIKQGGTVTWVNSSGGNMWVASAQHPSHSAYSGTTREQHCPETGRIAFDQCAGESGNYSFTFQKIGTWNYHDHLNASAFGSVTVVE